MKAVLLYAAIVLLTVAGLGWIFTLFFPGDLSLKAIRISAGIACVVQMVGFVIARRSRATNVIVGWSVGALLCLTSLVLFGFVTRPLGLPIEPALLSLATFYFVTETVEPLLLNT